MVFPTNASRSPSPSKSPRATDSVRELLKRCPLSFIRPLHGGGISVSFCFPDPDPITSLKSSSGNSSASFWAILSDTIIRRTLRAFSLTPIPISIYTFSISARAATFDIRLSEAAVV